MQKFIFSDTIFFIGREDCNKMIKDEPERVSSFESPGRLKVIHHSLTVATMKNSPLSGRNLERNLIVWWFDICFVWLISTHTRLLLT